jgi:hypothetical protein
MLIFYSSTQYTYTKAQKLLFTMFFCSRCSPKKKALFAEAGCRRTAKSCLKFNLLKKYINLFNKLNFYVIKHVNFLLLPFKFSMYMGIKKPSDWVVSATHWNVVRFKVVPIFNLLLCSFQGDELDFKSSRNYNWKYFKSRNIK